MAKKIAPLHWQTLEYEERERSADWYWAVGIITVSLAIASIIFNNVLFALVIILGGFVLSVYAARPPHEIDIVLDDLGIKIDKIFYPYRTLESFWVEQRGDSFRVLVKSQRLIMPYIIIPINLEEVEPEDVQTYLRRYLPEVFHSESPLHHLMEHLGL
jgi:hypothetical protein